VNPGPASSDHILRQTRLEPSTSGYVVVETWNEQAAEIAVMLLSEMHKACAMRSVEFHANCIALMPGSLGTQYGGKEIGAASNSLQQLESLLSRGQQSTWGDNDPVDAIWLVDGINPRGQSLVSEGAHSALAADVVAALLMQGARISAGASPPSFISDESGLLPWYRSLGLIRLVVPRGEILTGLATMFTLHLFREHIIGTRPTRLADVTIAANRLLSSLDPHGVEEKMVRGDGGQLLIRPFSADALDVESGAQFLDALQSEAEAYRRATFEDGCRKLFATSDHVRDVLQATLLEAVKQHIDAVDGGIRFTLGALDTCLDQFWRSSWIDDKRQWLNATTTGDDAYSFTVLRSRYADSLLRAVELDPHTSYVRDSVEQKGGGSATTDVEELKGASDRPPLQNGIVPADVLRERVWDTGPLQKVLAELLDSGLRAVRIQTDALDRAVKEATIERDEILQSRQHSAVVAFMLVPSVVLVCMLAMVLLLGFTKTVPFSSSLAPATLKFLAIGLGAVFAVTGTAFVKRVLVRLTRLSTRIAKLKEEACRERKSAAATVAQYFAKLFKLRVAERVIDALASAEDLVAEAREHLGDFAAECEKQIESLQGTLANDRKDASLTTVELVPHSVYRDMFAALPHPHIDATCREFYAMPAKPLSERALGGSAAVLELAADATAHGARALQDCVEYLGVDELLLQAQHRSLRETYAISLDGIFSLLRQVAPFAQLRDVPGKSAPRIARSLWVSEDCLPLFRDHPLAEDFDADGFSGVYAHQDRYSVLAMAATQHFSLRHINIPVDVATEKPTKPGRGRGGASTAR
jgi:F0F1-type ATP synthase membrane subunit b/b'